jgi:hypothetical protein
MFDIQAKSSPLGVLLRKVGGSAALIPLALLVGVKVLRVVSMNSASNMLHLYNYPVGWPGVIGVSRGCFCSCVFVVCVCRSLWCVLRCNKGDEFFGLFSLSLSLVCPPIARLSTSVFEKLFTLTLRWLFSTSQRCSHLVHTSIRCQY